LQQPPSQQGTQRRSPSPNRNAIQQQQSISQFSPPNEPLVQNIPNLADALNVSLQLSNTNKPAPRYYFGNISRQEAEDILLKSTKERVFLVRDSSKAGNYALSKYDPSDKVKKFGHLLIASDPDWHVKESRDLFHYASLEELISKTILLHGYIPIGQLYDRK